MTDNLRRSLHDLSQSEREHLAPLSVDLLQRRAHRSRVLRRTAQTAAGAGTAAAVVVGGMAGASALRDREPEPAPVATEPSPSASPTASPTAPTPTPTPEVTAPVWQPRWEDCGETVWDDSLMTIEDDGTQWVLQTPSYRERDITTRSSLDLELAAMSGAGGQESVTVRILDAVALQYDQESFTYTVAGVAAGPLTAAAAGDLAVWDFAGEMPAGLPLPTIDLTLTSCDAAPPAGGDGSLDAPLTGEWYGIMVTAEVTQASGEVLTVHSVVESMGTFSDYQDPAADSSASPPATIPGDPVQLLLNAPVRLGTDRTRNNASELRDNDPALATWCGADAASIGLGTGVSTAGTPATVTGTAFLDGNGELILQMTTTNTGPALTNTSLQLPDVWVVKDGRVVGKAYDPSPTQYRAPTWPTGSTVQLEMSIGQFTCTFMFGEYWPAGTYQLYASHGLSVPGTDSSAGRVDMVHSGPLSFTLP